MQTEPDKPAAPQHRSAPPSPRRATFAQTAKAVLWGFFGVRRRRDLERDAVSINPLHLIVVAIVLAALLVAGLITLVRVITH